MKHLAAFLLLAFLAPVVLADGTVYKWTDAQGVTHYSDKPPVEAASDVSTLDMPALPPQDPVKIAEHQAQLVAEAQAAQKLLQAQFDQQAQSAALAAQQAQLEAQLAAARQQAESQAAAQPAVQPIYVSSAFVPRAYRANLYFYHHHGDSHLSHLPPSLPAIPVLRKPR